MFTGSMEPAFKVGGVVVIKPVDPFDVQVGEVITYRAPISSEPMITHRVVGITGKTGSPRFFTKGDANESVDGFVIPQENIVGRVWLYIPLFGHLVRFVKTPIGLTLFLVVPGALLLWIEGKNIIHRVKRRAEKESA